MIHQPLQRLLARGPLGDKPLEARHLPVGAGAAGDDGPRVLDLGGAA